MLRVKLIPLQSLIGFLMISLAQAWATLFWVEGHMRYGLSSDGSHQRWDGHTTTHYPENVHKIIKVAYKEKWE